MVTVAVILILVVLGVMIYLTSQSALVPWVNHMKRLNAGAVNRAEWIAPNPIIENVKRDYLSFYDYATQTLPQGWLAYMRDLNQYMTDDLLREQRHSLSIRLQNDRGRIFDILRANHHIEVRNFSSDGLTCILIDSQTECRLATYDYWNGNRLHTQDVGDAAYVFKMTYDTREERWKMAQYIQTLPPGNWQSSLMEINPPHAVGRDQ